MEGRLVVVILALVLGCASGGPDAGDETDSPVDSRGRDTAPDDTTTGGDSAETGDSGPPATDADGDGALTPDDCDDADAQVYPGAYDWCDGVDQDCDSSPQGDGACGEIGVWSEFQVVSWEGTEPYMRFGAFRGVVDVGDGGVGLLASGQGLHTDSVDTDWSFASVLTGMPNGLAAWQDNAVGVWASAEYLDNLDTVVDAGDFNGDGFADLWLTSEGQSGCCEGGAFLVLGPSDRWPKEGAYIRDVADGWWLQAVEDDNFGGDQDAGEDVDGDGLPDAAFLAWGDIWDGTGGSLHVVLGRTGGLPNGGSIADEITLWKSDGIEDDVGYVAIAADMDGDGALEIALGGNGDLGVVSGSELAVADGSVLADWATFVRADQAAGPEFPSPDAVPGDIDGDGLDETILVYQNLPDDSGGTDEACLLFLSGPPALASGTVAGGTVATACVNSNATGGEHLGADVDFDGVRDLVVNWDTDFTDALGNYTDTDYLTCILPTSRLALGGRVEVPDVSLCLTGGAGTTADLDADGLPELVFAPSEATTAYENAGRVDVLPGFLIPWDDATKW